jgi:hypothetical protein
MKASTWRTATLVIITLAMAVFLSRMDWHATALHLQQLGATAPLMFLPYACVLSCDTLGWRYTFERPRSLRYWALWRVRVVTEAVANSMPAGVAVGETLKTVLLTRTFGISLSDSAANVIVSKVSLAIAHTGFLLVGLWFGASMLAQKSQALIGRPGLSTLYGVVVFTFFAVMVSVAVLAQTAALSRLLGHLIRIAPARMQESLEKLREPVARLDKSLAVIGRLPRRQVAQSMAYFLLGWLSLGCENWVILSLLTPHADFGLALSMEAIVSVVRMVFFFVPAGLGAQDVSYFALLNLWGLPEAEAVATAFMLLKRAKEACWVGVGYLLLWLNPQQSQGNSSSPEGSLVH